MKDYYKHFVSIAGILASLIGSFPLLASMLGRVAPTYARNLFPPLGQAETICALGFLLLAVGVTFIIFHEKDAGFVRSGKARSKVLRTTGVLSLVGLLAYLVFNHLFVREIHIPAKSSSVLVSVGFQRTDYARSREFEGLTDEELLKARSWTEEEIRRLWTIKSIVVARALLFLSYALTYLSLVGMCSLGVLYDLYGPPPDP